MRDKPLIDGRYQLGERLGQGGMATVYEATDIELDRPVAIKLLREYGEDESVRDARFQREAKALARVNHPNVVSIHDTGTHQGQRYIVMERVEGRSLASLIADRTLEPRRAVEILADVARGLQHCHEMGLVHRDIKPANVLVTDQGVGKLTDFGLALSHDEIFRLTGTGIILGTPIFMAPEQIQNDRDAIGPRTDVYALGVTLHVALTGGQAPFAGIEEVSDLTRLSRAMKAGPIPLTEIDAELPVELESIVRTAMAHDPLLRYPTAGALADDLRRHLDGEPIRVRPMDSRERLARYLRRRWPILLSIATTTLLLIFLLAWLVLG